MTRADARAFTLLEVLVALAVLGLVLPPLLTNAAERVRGLKVMEDRMIANLVAQNRLAMYRLSSRAGGVRPPRTEDGSEDMAGREWFWRANSTPTELEGYYRMDVVVGLKRDLVEPVTDVSAYFGIKR